MRGEAQHSLSCQCWGAEEAGKAGLVGRGLWLGWGLPEVAACLGWLFAALPGILGGGVWRLGLELAPSLELLALENTKGKTYLLRGCVPPAVPMGLFQLPGMAWSHVLCLCCICGWGVSWLFEAKGDILLCHAVSAVPWGELKGFNPFPKGFFLAMR